MPQIPPALTGSYTFLLIRLCGFSMSVSWHITQFPWKMYFFFFYKHVCSDVKFYWWIVDLNDLGLISSFRAFIQKRNLHVPTAKVEIKHLTGCSVVWWGDYKQFPVTFPNPFGYILFPITFPGLENTNVQIPLLSQVFHDHRNPVSHTHIHGAPSEAMQSSNTPWWC